MTEVRFQYDEDSSRWQVLVTGVPDELVAKQAFAAAVLTCYSINPGLQEHAKIKQTPEGYRLTPAV